MTDHREAGDDKTLMALYLEAVQDYSDEEAGKLVEMSGEWARLWRTGKRDTLHGKTRRLVKEYLERQPGPASPVVSLPSRKTLEELKAWVDAALALSPPEGADVATKIVSVAQADAVLKRPDKARKQK